MFLLIAVGAACRFARLFGDAGAKALVDVLVLVVTPCVIVDSFSRAPDCGAGQIAAGLSIAAAIHVASIFAAKALVRSRSDDVRRAMRVAAVFSNAGFMGIPLEKAILGDAGVCFGALYIAIFNIFIWTWGLGEIRGGKGSGGVSGAVSKLVLNPGVIGLAAALPLAAGWIELPRVASGPIRHLADMNTPVAMIVIGYYLAGSHVSKALSCGALHTAIALRLVAIPLATCFALHAASSRLDRNMILAFTIASSAPVAAMTSMFAAKYARAVDEAVAAVTVSTLLSMLTMPAIVALAMSLW